MSKLTVANITGLRFPEKITGQDRRHFLGGALVVLVAISVVPLFVADYWIFLSTAGFITAITVMGLAIIIGWAGQVTLAGAALLGTSVYITGYLMREGLAGSGGWPFIPALIIGALCPAVLSALIAVPTARFSGIYVMVLTMGLQVTLERTLFTYTWITGGVGADVRINRPKIFGFEFNTDHRYFYLSFSVMVIAAFVMYALRNSRHGRAIQLVRTDRQAAAAVGISPWLYRVVAFGIGGLFIGLAGAMTAPLYESPPALTQYILFQSLFLLAIPVVAGTQSITGLIVVSLTFQILPPALQSHRLSVYLLGGIGLVAGTLVGPRGIVGTTLDFLQQQRDVKSLERASANENDLGEEATDESKKASSNITPSKPATESAKVRKDE